MSTFGVVFDRASFAESIDGKIKKSATNPEFSQQLENVSRRLFLVDIFLYLDSLTFHELLKIIKNKL
jgi:hypothetical protein